ncbi:MAG: hypothetical protein EBR82_51170 [Caulobacteraceae bacterium]|nr:hypothetical protein [Caulobacteraceae bacterium]
MMYPHYYNFYPHYYNFMGLSPFRESGQTYLQRTDHGLVRPYDMGTWLTRGPVFAAIWDNGNAQIYGVPVGAWGR